MPETGEDDTQRNVEDIKNLINYPELIHKFPSNGKYLYGRSHILLALLLLPIHPNHSSDVGWWHEGRRAESAGGKLIIH